jgi:hypothetical protein
MRLISKEEKYEIKGEREILKKTFIEMVKRIWDRLSFGYMYKYSIQSIIVAI